MRTTISTLLLIAGLAGFDVCAQSPAPSSPKFEVASIKPCRIGDAPAGGAPTPGRLDLACVTVANLIRLAYLVFPTGERNAPVSPSVFQAPLSGGPAWIHSERYRVGAKTEDPVNVEMMKGPMMQALLAERFKLKLHQESKQTNVFELTVAKGGTKLQSAKEGACMTVDRHSTPHEHGPGHASPVVCGSMRKSARGGFDISGVSMADLCRQLSAFVDRDVVDKTGLKGVFDVHLELEPADVGDPDTVLDPSSPFTPGDGGAISVALKKLGLKMRSAKGTAHFLVIDHVERPSEN